MIDWNPAFILLLMLMVFPLERLARKLQYPVDALFFASGALASTLFIYLLDSDTGLRWDNLKPAILNLFLPAMIFRAIANLSLRVAQQCATLIIWLALPLGIISAMLIATGMYYGIGHSGGFPWLTAFIAGTLLAAVNAEPVLTLKSSSLVPEKLRVILSGESMLKDVTTILLFTVLLSFLGHSDDLNMELPVLFMQRFAQTAGLGAVIGIGCGYLGSKLIYWLRDDAHGIMLSSLLLAYGSFMLASHFNSSGVVALLLCGLTLRLLPRGSGGMTKLPQWQFSGEAWGFAARMLERLMFMLGGATITIGMFQDQWRTMLFAIAVVFCTRAAMILLTWMVMRLTHKADCNTLPWRHALYIFAGGGSGVVAICLVLALPFELTGWYTVQCAAYGLVIFYLFVQAPIISWLSRHDIFNPDAK